MLLSERALRRGLAPTAASDWRAADLPAALQGGARQAIFRGLYKGAEAAALRPGSSIALGRVAATLALAPGSRGARAWAARWPPTRAAGLSRAAGARTLCGSEGTGRRRGGQSGGAIPGAGLGCLLRCSRLSGGAAVGVWGASGSASPTSMGRRAARERPSTGQRHIPKSKPQKPLPNSPSGAEMKSQRRKCLTMAENKGELHRDAACARPRRRTLSPPRPARLRARRRSPTTVWFIWPELETGLRDWCPASLSVRERE